MFLAVIVCGTVKTISNLYTVGENLGIIIPLDDKPDYQQARHNQAAEESRRD